jgi:putative ATP-binding cassette transporter
VTDPANTDKTPCTNDHSLTAERALAAVKDGLGLAGKTRYGADGFSSLALSTGQKKRIALLAALLKERPILVLDELAADQDPQFRRHFYEELLPALKAQGLTLVCVTHDDHYFHVADRVLAMREGRLTTRAHDGQPGPVAGA